ncbi:MAG: rod shape-determining protein [Planctomyces sp.]|nr:rod shape-determining protein [Planctomyces sp.]
MLHRLRQWLSPDLAIDLGSANTRIALFGEGVVLDEPTVVALQKGSRKILGRGAAVGKLARQMLGRTPDSIHAVRPIRHGVITDFELCEAMLRHFVQKAARQSPGFRPRVLVSVPQSITPVERRAVFGSAERAGAGSTYLLESAKAAAIGAGQPISEPMASLMCNIGAGTSEIAIFSLGETVASCSSRIAGDAFDDAIIHWMKQRFGLKIGRQTAEHLKCEVGSASLQTQEKATEVNGLDAMSCVPRKVLVTTSEIRQALMAPLGQILAGIKHVLEQCDPELVADLADVGMVLAGGSALLPGLDDFFSEQLAIPVLVAEDPDRTVVRGLAICSEHLNQWQSSLVGMHDN